MSLILTLSKLNITHHIVALRELLTPCSDTDAQIERCQKRIEEGIMPDMFQARLKDLQKEKAKAEYDSPIPKLLAITGLQVSDIM